MTESDHTSILAIDGGGTKCRIGVRRDGVDRSVETGSANVSTDFDGAVRQIHDGLRSLALDANTDLDAFANVPAFIGLAGVTGPEIAGRLGKALPFKTVRIEDDRPAALRGALGHRDGVIAHCGTGSFFGSQIDGAMRFSGGWGSILGDEASAYWIGRLALGLALETMDGRADMSGLSRALLDQFGGTAGIVRFAGTSRPSDIGTLAPQVTEAARNGDPLGIRIMRLGASEIARSLPAIGWTPGKSICLTGGIGPEFEAYLPDDMQADIAPAAGTPLDGALSLAFDLAKGLVE